MNFQSFFQLLDAIPGKRHGSLFRRSELKTLVDFHGGEVLPSILSQKTSN